MQTDEGNRRRGENYMAPSHVNGLFLSQSLEGIFVLHL